MPENDPVRNTASRLLIDDQPLQVLPALAVTIGLNEAIILQQLHYKLRLERHRHEGVSWVYYTYEQWQQQEFPFWSADTIKRAIHALEAQGFILSTMRFNRSPLDKTKWYTISYERLQSLTVPSTGQNASSSMQNAPLDNAECTDGQGILPPLPKKIPTKKPNQDEDPPLAPPQGERYSAGFEAFWMLYPEKMAKDKAWQVWRRKRLESLTAEICASVHAHRDRDPHWRTGHIKHPAAFLTGGCWKDELPEASPVSSSAAYDLTAWAAEEDSDDQA